MTMNGIEHNKGPMGYMLDMRRAMGVLHTTAGEWCRAFDAGDMDALAHLGEIMRDVVGDVSEAAEKYSAATSGPG